MNARDRSSMPAILAAVGPFSDCLIEGGESIDVACGMLHNMMPLDAVRLVLAATLRDDSAIGKEEACALAEYLGVYEEIEVADIDG